MRTVWVGLLVVVCLVVIAIPAFMELPQPAHVPPPGRDMTRVKLLVGIEPIWLRSSPFGIHAEGWQGVLSAVASWVYLYITSALMLALFPRRVRLITHKLRSGGWRGGLRLFVIGLLATLVSALLILLARFAFVWSAMVIILTGAVFVLSYLGLIGASLMVGGSLRHWAKWSPSPWLDLVLGSLVLFALGRIPLAGWVCFIIIAAWGLGAVLATHLGSGEAWSLQDWQTDTEVIQ